MNILLLVVGIIIAGSIWMYSALRKWGDEGNDRFKEGKDIPGPQRHWLLGNIKQVQLTILKTNFLIFLSFINLDLTNRFHQTNTSQCVFCTIISHSSPANHRPFHRIELQTLRKSDSLHRRQCLAMVIERVAALQLRAENARANAIGS